LIKILHIINGDHYAGAERVQDLLALRLPDYGFQVGFVCLKRGAFAAARQAKNAPVYDLPMTSQFDLAPIKRIAAIVREEGYRLIHTHTPRAALLGQLGSWWTGVPMVHHLHSPTTRDTEHKWRNLRNSVVEKLSLIRARKIISVSDSLKQYLRQHGYAAERICVIPNGVPITPESAAASPLERANVVGMVALFRPRKGLEVLMRAAAQLLGQGVAVRLRAVGGFETPEYEASIRALEAELGLQGHVQWVGFTQDVASELTKMGVFALPSLFGEGMPMVVLEAMSAGLPVVATTVEGIPEVVRDGLEGMLVPPSDPASLALALRELVSNPGRAELLGVAGRVRQIALFSDASMAKSVAAVYNEVLGFAGKP
jgi:glycosyltransferase involved in cell wall biosynthesis